MKYINKKQYRKIRAAMMLHGVTNESIATSVKPTVTPNYVTFVITGRRVGYRIREAIAKACGVAVTEFWPDEDPEEPELPQAA